MGDYELDDDRDLDDLADGDEDAAESQDSEPWAKFSTGRDPEE
jgi:hypothetical protein